MSPHDGDTHPEEGVISVLLPFRDAVSTLERAIVSILAQTCASWELLLLDDGSTDGSTEIAADWAARDGRIQHIALPPKGIVAALNHGIALAAGELLFRMDGDDVAHPERIAAQCAYMAAHPEVGLCGTGVRIVGGSSGFERYEHWINGLLTHEDHVRELFVECPIPHPSFCLRRSALNTVGPYRDGPWPEDYELVLRLWRHGWKLGKLDQTLLDWHDSPGRLSRHDPRYGPKAFRALKRSVLLDTTLADGRPFFQWGAGEVGKPWLREWSGHCPQAVVDIRPGKVGQRIHGYEVILPEALPSAGEAFILIAVGTPGARDIIRHWLLSRHHAEGEDFVFIA